MEDRRLVAMVTNNNNELIKELEMGKKRDHKIMITDEAIEKVPLVKYREIPESEYQMLQDLAKKVLIVSKNYNESNEVALTYSLDYQNLIAEGKEYMGVTLGDEHSVDPCMNTVSNHLILASFECVVIVLHNHPSLSKFSLEDVQFFIRNKNIKMMVVVTNLGNVSYLVKKDNYDLRKTIELYNNAVSMNNEGSGIHDYQKAASYFLSNCYQANIVYEDH
jgi:ABC-type maltose transport system permease subunit